MILQTGITGYVSISEYNLNRVDKIEFCNVQDFKKISYNIANMGVFKIIRFNIELVGRNFYYLEAEMSGKRIFVLLNAMYPYIAFASNLQYMQIDFIDLDELSVQYEQFYKVLSFIQLEGDISKDELYQLSPVELDQVNYYRVV